jgi:hypothetical protein
MDVLQRSPSCVSLRSAFGKPFSPAEYDSADFFFFQVVQYLIAANSDQIIRDNTAAR